MASFGRQFRRERERRGLARSEVAEATSIYIHDLAALEFADFEVLPPDDVVEGFVRTYAEYLGFDVEEIVAEYRRSRPARPTDDPVAVVERSPGPAVEPRAPPEESAPEPESTVEPVVETFDAVEPDRSPEAVEPAVPPRRSIPPGRIAIAIGGLIVVAIVIGWGLAGGQRDDASRATTRVETPAVAAASGDGETTPTDESTEAAPATVDPSPVAEIETDPPRADVTLGVTEHGVGTGVVDRRLVGESDRFAAGTRVWFWTRVVGGAPGTSVDHVWLYDGREVDRITLRVDSANWRTHSAKRVYEIGRWAVEARAPAGAVLARGEFDCVAK